MAYNLIFQDVAQDGLAFGGRFVFPPADLCENFKLT